MLTDRPTRLWRRTAFTYAASIDVLVMSLVMAVLLAASPVGAWYTNRHPAVRNDTWGGALGLALSWLGFLVAVVLCAWRARRARSGAVADVSGG
jgi:sterol desaturase/sphingolipid hydroxylase (fatty acid hydroxylase superfamily)